MTGEDAEVDVGVQDGDTGLDGGGEGVQCEVHCLPLGFQLVAGHHDSAGVVDVYVGATHTPIGFRPRAGPG